MYSTHIYSADTYTHTHIQGIQKSGEKFGTVSGSVEVITEIANAYCLLAAIIDQVFNYLTLTDELPFSPRTCGPSLTLSPRLLVSSLTTY